MSIFLVMVDDTTAESAAQSAPEPSGTGRPDVPSDDVSQVAKGRNVTLEEGEPNRGFSARSTTERAAAEALTAELIALDFSVHVSLRYHAKRRAWFDSMHRLSMVISAVGGSAALATIASSEPFAAAMISLVVALSGAFNVAFAPAEKARKYDELYRRFAALAAEITGTKAPRADDMQAWQAKKLTIEADEPTVIDILNVICHNAEAQARGYSLNHQYPVRWYQHLFAQIITLPPNDWPHSLAASE